MQFFVLPSLLLTVASSFGGSYINTPGYEWFCSVGW